MGSSHVNFWVLLCSSHWFQATLILISPHSHKSKRFVYSDFSNKHKYCSIMTLSNVNRAWDTSLRCRLLTLTGSHSATCLSLMRLKPVVRIFSSDTNTALMGLEPSWGFSFSCTWSRDSGVTDFFLHFNCLIRCSFFLGGQLLIVGRKTIDYSDIMRVKYLNDFMLRK